MFFLRGYILHAPLLGCLKAPTRADEGSLSSDPYNQIYIFTWGVVANSGVFDLFKGPHMLQCKMRGWD